MTDSLHFAQISDIHISDLGDHHDLLSGRSASFLSQIVIELNQIEDLDFVLISGDLFDTASLAEFERFQVAIRPLQKPFFVIPGNHDRRDAGATEGLTRHDFARHFNPQIEQRSTRPESQVGYWSVEVHPEVQLIGLDSIVDDDWNGRLDAEQVAWLESELKEQAEKIIMVAIHHPLHKLAPIDDHPQYRKFVCDNGPDLLALLDRHPSVKLVLTGHHHQSKADWLSKRLHLACPAVGLYPCAYRTLRLIRQSTDAWQITWQTHAATDPETMGESRRRMAKAWVEAGFAPDFVELHIQLALGTAHDRSDSLLIR
ncbi:MAG: metallophosphoesterase [Anaerolineae bacterium]|nr:metallophosphoesterase [Anaerolineae bacterium]